MAGGAKRNHRWEVAISALLSQGSLDAAARRANISPKTLDNWLRLPAFLESYRAARRNVLENTIAHVTGATVAAVGVLKDCLSAPRPADRIRAAVALLS